MVFRIKDKKVYVGRKYIREANAVEQELWEEIERYKAEQAEVLKYHNKWSKQLDKIIKAGQ